MDPTRLRELLDDVRSGARTPRAMVFPVSVLLPLDGASIDALASSADPATGLAAAKVKVEVSDAETMSARAPAGV